MTEPDPGAFRLRTTRPVRPVVARTTASPIEREKPKDPEPVIAPVISSRRPIAERTPLEREKARDAEPSPTPSLLPSRRPVGERSPLPEKAREATAEPSPSARRPERTTATTERERPSLLGNRTTSTAEKPAERPSLMGRTERTERTERVEKPERTLPRAGGLAFTMNDFPDAFDGRAFVERLIRTQVENAQSTKDDFDTQPFRQLFASSLADLKTLKEQVNSNIFQLVQESKRADIDRKSRIATLTTQLSDISESFQKLDTQMNGVGETAVRIGERLDQYDRQRSRALEAKQLIEYFIEFTQDRVPDVFTSTSRLYEAAALILKLNNFAQELRLDGPDAQLNRERQSAIDRIEQLSGKIENDLLVEFEAAQKMTDYARMTRAVKCLLSFHGGDACVRRYAISRYSNFVTSTAHLVPSKTPRSLDDDTHTSDKILETLLKQVAKECETAVAEVTRVFPSPGRVMSLLVFRIFEEKIQSYVSEVLARDEGEPLCYLRTLQSTYKMVSDLARDLSKIDTGDARIVDRIDQIFGHYLKDYMEKEEDCLRICLVRRIEAWKAEIQTIGLEKSLGDVEVPIDMMHAAEEAMNRAAFLTSDAQRPMNVFNLFLALVQHLGHDYIFAALDRGMEEMSRKGHQRSASSGGDQDLATSSGLHFGAFLKALQSTTDAVIRLQRCAQLTVSPNVSSNARVQQEAKNKFETILVSMEDKAQQGLERVLAGIMNYAVLILTKLQQKTDYRPKDSVDDRPTLACSQLITFMDEQLTAICNCVDGQNRTMILSELANRLYLALAEHIKKFTISLDGGIRLLRDLSEYKMFAQKFKIDSVSDQFELLLAVATIFMVKPENVSSLREKGDTLYRLPDSEFRAYVKQRPDYKQVTLPAQSSS